ncbi:hypothetical protein PDESU_02736 [Pontiella desulfatans]|uniref:PEP-CTERM protein-sorting domain-containing protein n=1 Tax=Pontiella desulfatans TaxID=2750659 RepID=A0A6C2U2T5_PONDE|nr:PEP-CTERM sorting domain-containing protein [Pontiella desulfatans]VGO14177.1 hypothetical protein PDESU_02736 [Pontiella desulfatans]
MRNALKATIIMLTGMLAVSSNAELIGSLHMSAGVDINNVDVMGPELTRTGNGNVNTRGTVAGTLNFLAGTTGLLESDVRAFSASTVLRDLNRFGNNSNGGSLMTWDYDFTGQSSPSFNFHVDFTAEGGKPVDQELRFYVSYNNGGSLSLDTTDITSATPGAGALVSGNTAEYISLLNLGPTATSGILDVDITSIVNTAIANGGGIRIALVDNTFRNTVTFFNDSGIQAIPEPATLGLIAAFGGGILFIRRRFMI